MSNEQLRAERDGNGSYKIGKWRLWIERTIAVVGISGTILSVPYVWGGDRQRLLRVEKDVQELRVEFQSWKTTISSHMAQTRTDVGKTKEDIAFIRGYIELQQKKEAGK